MEADPGGLPREVPQDGGRPARVLPRQRLPVLRRRRPRPRTRTPTTQSGRIWIHGDLHVENFGTYLNSDGRLVFDVNDFDEAYLGRFTWDLQRFAASLALVGWQKALPEDDVRCADRHVRPRLPRPGRRTTARARTTTTSRCTSTTPHGPIHEALVTARSSRRADLLDDDDRARRRRPDAARGRRRCAGSASGSGPRSSRRSRATSRRSRRTSGSTGTLFYDLRDVAGKSGFGIGSAGLPAYNLLVEGYSQALDNDVLLSMKQANVPGGEPVRRHRRGRRTTSSTRATAPWSASGRCRCTPTRCWATPRSTASGTSSPRCRPTRWTWTGRTSPSRTRSPPWSTCSAARPPRSTAPPTRTATRTSSTSRWRRRSPTSVRGSAPRVHRPGSPTSGWTYAEQVREDHAHFVDAFRDGRIGVVPGDLASRVGGCGSRLHRPAPADGSARRCAARGSPRPRTRRRRRGPRRRRARRAPARSPSRRSRRRSSGRRPPPPRPRSATTRVELGAGDLEVVAHRDVRGEELPADLVPVAGLDRRRRSRARARSRSPRAGPGGGPARRRAPRQRPGRPGAATAPRVARPPPRSPRGGRRTRRRRARGRPGCR